MIPVDVALVRKLVAAQFPHWASLEIRPVAFGGWDNRTFHLGEELTVRLPSAAGYAASVEKEQRWLPVLAPRLPLTVPVPVGRGVPAFGYPFGWSVNPWIPGETAREGTVADRCAFAVDLADFLLALQAVDATGGPAAGAHCFYRGAPLAWYDDQTRTALARHGDAVDTRIWDAALAARWDGPPVWFHGDVADGNLIVRDGRLSAVIDFGTSGVGDPACDVTIAWTSFSGDARAAFRGRLAVDDAMWARARGWTLWKALITLDDDDQALVAWARRVLRAVRAEWLTGQVRP